MKDQAQQPLTQDEQKEVLEDLLNEVIEWTTRDTGSTINVTVRDARARYGGYTKSGKPAPPSKVREFLATCKRYGFDPDAGDAWLLGYDGQNGPEFSTIVAYQVLARRAESHPQYDGIESGIVCEPDKGGGAVEIPGAIVPKGMRLIGGWAKVYRKDRSRPAYARIPLEGYDKKRALWSAIPASMIQKCAKAAAQRDAFPGEVGAMYCSDEIPERDTLALGRAIEATEASARAALNERIRKAGQASVMSGDAEIEASGGRLFATHPDAAQS